MPKSISSIIVVALVLAACGAGVCQTPFTFVSSVPANGGQVSDPNTQVTLRFSQPVNPQMSGVIVTTVATPVQGVPVTLSLGSTTSDLVVSFPSSLPANGDYNVDFQHGLQPVRDSDNGHAFDHIHAGAGSRFRPN